MRTRILLISENSLKSNGKNEYYVIYIQNIFELECKKNVWCHHKKRYQHKNETQISMYTCI